MKVERNTRVVIKYTVRFEEGADAEQTPNVYRAELIVGYDRIIPAIEEKLLGAEEGDTFEIRIPKQRALGSAHPVYASVSIVEVRAATAEEIAARRKASCSGG